MLRQCSQLGRASARVVKREGEEDEDEMRVAAITAAAEMTMLLTITLDSETIQRFNCFRLNIFVIPRYFREVQKLMLLNLTTVDSVVEGRG